MTHQKPTASHPPLRILPSHERLLLALSRYERLTAEQTKRLLFGDGSLTYVQTKYKELADAGYVLRVPVGRPAPHGSGPLAYRLDRRGRTYLRSLGVVVPRLRQSEERTRAAHHLRHGMMVVDVLILAALLCRQDARFAIARMRGERALRRMAVAVPLGDGVVRGVALDAWIDLRISAPDGAIAQMCLGFEVDTGTEWQTAWRRKIRALLAFETGPYRRAFAVDTLTIVVVAPTVARREQLCHWTDAELTARGARRQADLFRFGAMPAELGDARAFFLDPHWFVPGQGGPMPLIASS